MRARIGIIGPVIIILGIASSACRRGGDCERGDMLAQMGPELRTMVESLPDQDWLHDVTTCQVGPFTVIGPTSGDHDEMLILRGKEFIYSRTNGSSSMFTPGMSSVDLVKAKEPGKPPVLSYTVRDGSGGTVMVLDRDFDGQADMRLRSYTGRPNMDRRDERWRNDRWVEIIDLDGRRGYMLDGKFVALVAEDTDAH